MGAGPSTDIPACSPGGDGGAFRTEMRLANYCATGSLMPDQTFIVAGKDPAANNFTGTLAATFGCIAELGSGGCSFEHQFASMLRALGADGKASPAANDGFLRPDANLVVVLLTDEDDCSAPPDSVLFSTESAFASDPLGPLSSYRCNEFGHRCGGESPPRTPAPGGSDLSGTCKSAEDGILLKVSDVVSRLKALKPDPSHIYVAALAGPPDPYVVNTGPATLAADPIQQWPQVRPSCSSNDGRAADPGVRVAELVRAFGDNGLFQTICADSFEPALTAIGDLVVRAVTGVPCLDAGTPVDQCKFVVQGTQVETPLRRCRESGDAGPCWSAAPGAACGDGLLIQLNGLASTTDLVTIATCPQP
jgi:hypothetical protein